MPLPQYRLAPCVVEPFVLTWDSDSDGERLESGSTDAGHPIRKVLKWQEMLERDRSLTKVQIAKNSGLTKSRITHMFLMLRLPEEAQRYLAGLDSSQAIQFFSVRRLKALAKLPMERQREEFAAMQAGCAERGY